MRITLDTWLVEALVVFITITITITLAVIPKGRTPLPPPKKDLNSCYYTSKYDPPKKHNHPLFDHHILILISISTNNFSRRKSQPQATHSFSNLHLRKPAHAPLLNNLLLLPLLLTHLLPRIRKSKLNPCPHFLAHSLLPFLILNRFCGRVLLAPTVEIGVGVFSIGLPHVGVVLQPDALAWTFDPGDFVAGIAVAVAV